MPLTVDQMRRHLIDVIATDPLHGEPFWPPDVVRFVFDFYLTGHVPTPSEQVVACARDRLAEMRRASGELDDRPRWQRPLTASEQLRRELDAEIWAERHEHLLPFGLLPSVV